MSRTFDERQFEQLTRTARQLVEGATEQEGRLVSFVHLLQGQPATTEMASGHTSANWSESFSRNAVDSSLSERHIDLLPSMRTVCASAREQRECAEALLMSLVGEVDDVGPPPTRVLIVDDSQDMRELLVFALQAAGFGTITASDGLQALIAAHTLRPAIVLMDLNMPVLDGIEATRLLKAGEATRHVPVIAHTGKPEYCDGLKGRLFTQVLPKPAAPSDVVASVRRHLATIPLGPGAPQFRREVD
jgi:two-component system, cell cycle response regulator DivK